MLTLTVQIMVLVAQKVYHQFCLLLCTHAGATVALIELRGNQAVVRSDTRNETVRLKVSGLRQNSKVARIGTVQNREQSPKCHKEEVA